MTLLSARLVNYRNLADETLTLCDNVNVLYGDNAQGKTNITEAIWLFAACRSFRAAADRELVRHGGSEAEITAIYEKNGREHTSGIKLYTEKRRELSLNGVKTAPKEFLGAFNAVVFYPELLGLVKNGPEGRRKFLDFCICQIRPVYYSLLTQYNRVLTQRNALLKSRASGIMQTLPVWDLRLSRVSALITATRRSCLQRLSAAAGTVLDEISSGKEVLSLDYISDTASEEQLSGLLSSCRERDLALGHTTVGAHKDDFSVKINGADVKSYGSQGQQRSCVMALKLAEAQTLKEVYGEYPLILLDDVFSELDASRREYITDKIKDKQVIITSCDKTRAPAGSKLIRVCGGRVYEEN